MKNRDAKLFPAKLRQRVRSITGAHQFAVISDLHGNLEALRAVLTALDRRGVHDVICLGDVAGYGPHTSDCLALLRQRGIPCLRGNHDVYVASNDPLPWELSPQAAESAEADRREVPATDRRLLGRLPWTFETPGFAFVHASYPEPEAWWYVIDERDAAPHLAAQPAPVSFFGHTHRQGGWESGPAGLRSIQAPGPLLLHPGSKYALNPGSVGQPRDRNPRAAFLICEPARRRIEFLRVRYNLTRALQAYRRAGREEMGLRLRTGT